MWDLNSVFLPNISLEGPAPSALDEDFDLYYRIKKLRVQIDEIENSWRYLSEKNTG